MIEHLTGKGIIVGFGHSDATCEQIADCVDAGLKYCVHFTNGPTGNSYKPFNGGGAVEAVLKSDKLYAELICDGYHVNPAYIRDIIKRKGIDKIIGVTDCMFAADSELKDFTSGNVRGVLSDDGNYFRVVGKKNALFSSNLTMDRGFANTLNWLTMNMEGIWRREHQAIGFDRAMAAAAKMFSTNPCIMTGLAKEGFGTIVDGAKADLCVVDITGTAGDYNVTIEKTIVDGNIVYSRN